VNNYYYYLNAKYINPVKVLFLLGKANGKGFCALESHKMREFLIFISGKLGTAPILS